MAERVAALVDEVLPRLTEWHGLMRRNPVEARHLLTTLLRGRRIFQPKKDSISTYYEFTGEGAISALIGGSISPELFVTPAGCEDLGGRLADDLGGLLIRDMVRVRTRAA